MGKRTTRRGFLASSGGVLGAYSVSDSVSASGTKQENHKENSQNEQKGYEGEGRLLLDKGRKLVGKGEYMGSEYKIYRYKNFFSFANGIEVYYKDKRVITHERVNNILDDMAWENAVDSITQDDIDALETVVERAESIDTENFRPLLDALDRFWDIYQEIKSKKAWGAVTFFVPSLKAFIESVKTIRSTLRDWDRSVSRVKEKVPPLINLLKKVKAGRSNNYSELSRRLKDASSAINSLRSNVNEIEDQIKEIGSSVGKVSSAVESNSQKIISRVPLVKGTIRRLLDGFVSSLREIESQIAQARQPVTNLRKDIDKAAGAVNSAESEVYKNKEPMMEAWEKRLDADKKLNATVAIGTLLTFGVAMNLVYKIEEETESDSKPSKKSGAKSTEDTEAPEKDEGVASLFGSGEKKSHTRILTRKNHVPMLPSNQVNVDTSR